MNKEKYEIPVTEIICFETEDIITTSGIPTQTPTPTPCVEVGEGNTTI